MGECRYLVSDTHVWPFIVVEMNEPSDYVPCVLQAVEGFPRVDGFILDYAVGPFRDGVVCRVVVFGHAYSYAVCLERPHIVVAAVLHATVRVVYKAFQRYTSGLRYGLFEDLYSDGGTQRLGNHPSDDLVRIGIRYQMQITHVPAVEHDIGDVRNP